MLAQRHNLRLRDEGGSRGRSSTQDQKTRTISTCWSNRQTISAIPPYCALWGFWCLNMANWVRYPFSERFPLGEHAKWRCDTPPQKGYLSDTRATPYENKANGCDTPLCDTISKRYCAICGGISHWAAKLKFSNVQARLFFQDSGPLGIIASD